LTFEFQLPTISKKYLLPQDHNYSQQCFFTNCFLDLKGQTKDAIFGLSVVRFFGHLGNSIFHRGSIEMSIFGEDYISRYQHLLSSLDRCEHDICLSEWLTAIEKDQEFDLIDDIEKSIDGF
jgi:hypothetical protein